ncbi:MAG TPA: FAD-dependent oxidoreductase [Vicinamibacterales bacterium]|nr:FAD-dependent oxidoreductase [Vicinamibacterales bacterium]
MFPKLDTDLAVDTVVVGAGITGLTAACQLAEAGQTVAVLERGRCAQVDTGHTSAHLTMVTDSPLSELVDRFGPDHARAAWDAGLAAIDWIEATVEREGIDCGFERIDGYLHAPVGPAPPPADVFEREAALARECGFAADFVRETPWAGGPGVRFEGQARVHPRRYLAGVAKAIRARGGAVFEHTAAEAFVNEPRAVKANGHTVSCGQIVIATHNPLVGIAGMVSASIFQTKLALYTSYVVAGRVRRGAVPDALFWDTADPYRYVRIEPHREYDVVIVGGEDHKTGQVADTEACYTRLEQAARERVPGLELMHRWSGQVIETPDGLPYVGLSADRQWLATGFAGNGLTFGTAAAAIIADAILGRRNPWTDLFEPGRSAVRRGAWDYVAENADYPYYLLRGRLASIHAGTARALRRGEGRIIEIDGRRAAAFRDDSGRLEVVDAVCTHMGCVVAWNAAERTWDCPCHGSRFRTDGTVISGPAEQPLSPVDLPRG